MQVSAKIPQANTFDPAIYVAISASVHDTPTQSDYVGWKNFRSVCLSTHIDQPRKDGIGYIFARLNGGKRDEDVESVSCLAYDIDGKLPITAVSSAVSASALEAVLWTTYNHLNTQSTVGAKSFRRWAKTNGYGEKPTDASMQAFCASNRKYVHLANVSVGNGGETVRVKHYDSEFDAFVIDHDPEHKTRAILAISEPIPLNLVGKDGYKAIYHAVGRRLFGDAYDTTCCNPARLNYGPSQRPGATGHVIEHHEGSLLDWKPVYDECEGEIIQRREESARRRTEWINSPACDLAELHHVLASIPSDLPYDQWFRCLAAIFHETHGSEDGRALAHSWSERDDDRYDFDQVDAIWDSFNLDHSRPATMGTLVRLAKEFDPEFRLVSASVSLARVAKFFGGVR